KTADAYAQGYLNGQQAIAARFDEEQERHDALAQAIDQLKPADEVKLAKLLQKTVLSLFRQAVGDAELMDRGCRNDAKRRWKASSRRWVRPVCLSLRVMPFCCVSMIAMFRSWKTLNCCRDR